MCSQQEKKIINHFNRTIIGISGIVGALLDGFTSGDTLCILSMIIWLWQSEWGVLEERCLDTIKQAYIKRKALK